MKTHTEVLLEKKLKDLSLNEIKILANYLANL